MPKLIVVTREGEEREIEGEIGLSVMEAIRDAGHRRAAGAVRRLLFVRDVPCACRSGRSWIVLPKMSADEDDLLDASDDRERDLAPVVPGAADRRTRRAARDDRGGGLSAALTPV